MQWAGQWYFTHPSRSDEFSIWPFGDVHFGNRGCAIELLKTHIAQVHDDPMAFWFAPGDLADYIAPGDKRFDPAVLGPDIGLESLGNLGRELCSRVGKLFEPIAHKCLGIGIGNHEIKYERATNQDRLHYDLLKHLSDRAGRQIPHLGYTGMFDLIFVRVPRRKTLPKPERICPVKGHDRRAFRFVVEHGTGASRSRGGKANRLASMAARFEADIGVQGHLHDPDAFPVTRIGANHDCSGPAAKNMMLVRTGSYLRTYQQDVLGYGEIAGYNPVTLGAKPIHIQPTPRKIWAEISVVDHSPTVREGGQ